MPESTESFLAAQGFPGIGALSPFAPPTMPQRERSRSRERGPAPPPGSRCTGGCGRLGLLASFWANPEERICIRCREVLRLQAALADCDCDAVAQVRLPGQITKLCQIASAVTFNVQVCSLSSVFCCSDRSSFTKSERWQSQSSPRTIPMAESPERPSSRCDIMRQI